MRKQWKYRCIGIMFMLLVLFQKILFYPIQAHATEEIIIKDKDLYAQAAILMDADSGRILYGKNVDEKKPNASTTKIMTCILALELKGNALDTWIPVSLYAANQPKVHMGMCVGEQYRLEDLLYAMMLESDNDAATLIGEWLGSEKIGLQSTMDKHTKEESQKCVLAFSDMMNEKAKEIGCENTCFLTPNGLDCVRNVIDSETGEKEEQWHGTTATDLARIMSYCVRTSPQKELFLELTQTQGYSFEEVQGKRAFQVTNHNRLLQTMEENVSGKTGFTNKAGYCYVGAFTSEERNYVIALLGCGWPNCKSYKWKDCQRLLTYGMENYEKFEFKTLGIEAYPLQKIRIENGVWKNQQHISYATASAECVGLDEQNILVRKEEQPRMEVHVPSVWKAPVVAGTEVGEIVIKVGDMIWKKIPVRLNDNVDEITYKWCFLYYFMNKYLLL